jgi:thioredoxin 1
MISPHFAKMEEKYPGVKLVKVDVEEQEVCSFLFFSTEFELTK